MNEEAHGTLAEVKAPDKAHSQGIQPQVLELAKQKGSEQVSPVLALGFSICVKHCTWELVRVSLVHCLEVSLPPHCAS